MGTVSSCRIFALPLLPVALQSAVECTYPIPEELSATCLILFGNIVGIVCTFSIQSLLELKHYRTFSEYGTVFTPSLLFVASVMFIAWISIVLFNGKYKRLEAEKNVSKENIYIMKRFTRIKNSQYTKQNLFQ